jgi:hypothetical protein
MKIRIVFIILCIIGASGCAAPIGTIDYYAVDTASLKRVKPLQEIDEQELASGGYKQLGSVTGFHCRRAHGMGGYGADQAGAEQTAIDQLRLRAAQKGASHYTSPSCVVSESMDLTNNCWASIKCTSRALSR